jgi:hypothetical protein
MSLLQTFVFSLLSPRSIVISILKPLTERVAVGLRGILCTHLEWRSDGPPKFQSE